jgi:hypothetical protein
MWPWKKRKKLLMLSLACFSSMILLQLCYLILEHHILSYLLHMLGSIICPSSAKVSNDSSPGGDMPAWQLCPKVNLEIRG